MSAPEISFCIPTYNSAARIERCLRAVLAQPGPSREIIVVDNASTDDTVARARQLLQNFPEARVVVNEKNIGRIENWNRCLELAAGRYIKFALANDVLLPGSTEILWQQAHANPGVVMVCGHARSVEEIPATPDPMVRNAPVKILETKDALRHLSEVGNDTGSLNGILINGEIVRRDGLRLRPDIPFWSDFHFAVELAARGQVVYIDGDSYLFDNSVKSRFTHAGLDNRAYYFEGRQCALTLAALLPKYGFESWRGFDFIFRQYTGLTSNYGLKPLGYRDTLALFEGAGSYRRKALTYPVRHKFHRLKHYARRAASKLGLHR
jgi:glycosyltransferase involved in cell wall biosynthesis